MCIRDSSRSEFIVDEVLYYVIKRVKGTIEGDVCEVEDDEIIAFNFPTKLDKGVKVTSTFRRNKIDSIWQLEGCLLYTSDAADERSSVDLGGRRIIKKKKI